MNVGKSVIAAPSDTTKTEAVHRLNEWMKSQGQSVWAPKIPETLNANGFRDAKRYDIDLDMSLLRFFTDIHVSVWAEVAAGLPEGERKEEFARTVAEVEEEVKLGVGYGRAKFVFVAQRED